MRVTILPERQTHEIAAKTVAELLAALRLHQDAHLVVRGQEILTRDVRLDQSDEVEVFPVISGGGDPERPR